VEQPVRLLHEFLSSSARRLPSKNALFIDGRGYSYQELFAAAACFAAACRENGLDRGDRVAIFMDNTWPCVVSIFGTLMAGGVFLVINPQTKTGKLKYILIDSEARFLVSDVHLKNIFLPAVKDVPGISGIILSGKGPIVDCGSIPVYPFEEFSAQKQISDMVYDTIPLDLAALIYTSGTTGNPKGVMMTHQSMVFSTASIAQFLRLSEHDRIINVLPMAFDYGLYQLLMCVCLGAGLVLEKSFAYTASIFKKMKDHQVTVFPGVPTIFSTLIVQHSKNPLLFPSITRVTNTAADLPVHFSTALKEMFPSALVFRMYGLTECKRVCYLEPELMEKKPNSVGKAIPGTEVFLLSPEGKPVAAEQIGILHVRGPHIMRGYWKQPELSAKMLKQGKIPGEQVLCTQDWFKMDVDGDLYFIGRSDDIIKTRGEKVSPVEVENALYGIQGIREAAVIGEPDPVLGEKIHAFVSLAAPAVLTEKEIIGHCLAKLENFMVPQKVSIVDELPKTATGKISKKNLSALNLNGLP
jgi:long-chain acyl-CoA synthetase